MRWHVSNRASKRALPLADRHYSRQQPGTPQFVKPARCVVLLTEGADALWVSAWQKPEYVKHDWPGAWECATFRNESLRLLSSELIREAVAATLAVWGEPPDLGMITTVDPRKVRGKPRRDYGMCFQLAGFVLLERKTAGGLFVLQLTPDRMPAASEPLSYQRRMFKEQLL